MKTTLTIDDLKRDNLIIYEVIAGSHLFGLNTETSDEDFRGVYVQPVEMIATGHYKEQVTDEKGDTVYYELNKFIQMLLECKPNAVEILFAPKECIIRQSDRFSYIMSNRDKFLNNSYVKTSIKFAESQIKKAQGLNKKLNWDKDKVERKGVLDFCFVPYGQGSMDVNKFLRFLDLKQEYCGLVALKNMRYAYGVYYDVWQHIQMEKLSKKEALNLLSTIKSMGKVSIDLNEYDERIENWKNLKYKGIVQDVIESNDISLCEVPKDDYPIIKVMQFNKDGYSTHCKDYREYQDYLKKRNVNRYTDYNEHGQSYDGKNLLHMMRSLIICEEFITTGDINLDRRNLDRDYLLSIKKGKVDLKTILDEGLKIIEKLEPYATVSDISDEIRELSIFINLKIRGLE